MSQWTIRDEIARRFGHVQRARATETGENCQFADSSASEGASSGQLFHSQPESVPINNNGSQQMVHNNWSTAVGLGPTPLGPPPNLRHIPPAPLPQQHRFPSASPVIPRNKLQHNKVHNQASDVTRKDTTHASTLKEPKKRKSPSKRKPTNVPVISVTSIETQVFRAARLVANELQNGPWPEASPGSRQQAAAALEEFCKTIFLPNLLRQRGTSSNNNNERVFVATMLAMREVLTQNAERIFHLEKVPLQADEQEGENDEMPGSKRRKRQDHQEEKEYMGQLFATAVVHAAIRSLPEAETYLARFTELVDSYDTGDANIASCMAPRDGRHEGVTPNGKTFNTEENVAWKVSYNRALDSHPVVCRNRRKVEQQQSEESHTIEVPKPNAVFVSMVEQL